MKRGVRAPRPVAADGISGFDGLRALAALTVFSYHAALVVGISPAGGFAPLLWELKGGVAVFFAISGVLLYLPYARAIRDGRDLPDWRAYAGRRAVRILPAYWVALTVVGLGPFHATVFGSDAWNYYGLSQVYRPETLFGGLGVAWSLCVEVSFYALLPLFGQVASRLSRRVASRRAPRVQLGLIAITGLASIVVRGIVSGSLTAPAPVGGKALMVALPGLLDWFAIGMAIAVLRAEFEAGRGAGSLAAALARRPGWCVVLSFTLFCIAVPWQHGDQFLAWYGVATHAAMGAGAGLLILAIIAPARSMPAAWPVRLLAHPAAVWVGTVSYGVYLWHLPLLMFLEPHLLRAQRYASLGQAALVWVIGLACALACGAASYYLVERPSQRWFRARESRRRRPVRGGRMDEINVSVHSTIDPLNPSGVAVDHLA